MNAPRFRHANAADAPLLAEFMARNFLATYSHCSTPENVAAAVAEHYGLAAQQRQIADPSRLNLLCEDERGTLLGHAQLHFDASTPPEVAPLPAGEVARFYVDTSAQGRGLAQLMLAESERLARERGCVSLWLSCWQEQPQALRFYEKSGFVRSGTLVFYVGDDPKDDWLMVKPL
jgi:GNAT superfamily N-acetyltransferase